jgi:hypothetical protein
MVEFDHEITHLRTNNHSVIEFVQKFKQIRAILNPKYQKKLREMVSILQKLSQIYFTDEPKSLKIAQLKYI